MSGEGEGERRGGTWEREGGTRGSSCSGDGDWGGGEEG